MYNLLYMPRRLILVFSSLLLLFVTLFSSVSQIRAQSIIDLENIRANLEDFQAILDEAGSTQSQEEFCERRSGDQMNLETWFSGKCKVGDDLQDSFTGEGVGFSSIIFLDLMERIQGKQDPDKSFFDKLLDLIGVYDDAVSEGKSNEEINLALQEKRSEIFQENNGGIIGTTGKGIAFLLNNPPASTKNYFDYVAQNLRKNRIIPEALAQSNAGYSFTGLTAFLPIWKMFRTIAYIIFVFFFIVYGFMMMFRVNISAKTVITVQLALPKLIGTLLLITFSYAIVGLMVDLMYLVFYATISLLQQQNLIGSGNLLVTFASGQGGALLSFITNTFFAGPASAIGVINLVLGGPSLLSGAIGLAAGFSGFGMIINLIIFIAIGISYIRLFWKLLTAFLTVIISLVIAPIVLLANALPGNDSFGTWFRGVFANLSVFPITMILLTFSYILMVQPIVNLMGPTAPDAPITISYNILEWFFGVKNLNPGGYLMQVPFVSPPLSAVANFMGNAPDAMLALFGVALLLMSSKYVDIVRDALKAPPFKYGAAIGDALKYGVNVNDSLARKGYEVMGTPILPRRASAVYPGSPSVKPTVQLGPIDTGFNFKEATGSK